MSTSALSNQSSLPTYSGMKAALTVTQSTDISFNDHVKWNTVAYQVGSDITMDTSTAYTTAAGAPSIGRFTLKGGKTYRIEARVPVQMSGLGAMQYRLYNVTASAWHPHGAYAISPTGGNAVESTGGLTEIVSPASDTLYEIRIWGASNISSIFSSQGEPHIVIETVASQIPYQPNVFLREVTVTKSQSLKQNAWDQSGLHTWFLDIDQTVGTWTTLLTITPSPTANTWYNAIARADIVGHTGGVDNGTLAGAVWNMNCTNGAMSSGQLVAPTTTGGGAPQFRVLTSGSQWLVQAASSNTANAFQGSARIEIQLPHSAGSLASFTIA